jgi:hypothetical protein
MIHLLFSTKTGVTSSGNTRFGMISGAFDASLQDYFPSLNFLYPSYLSFANCEVLSNNSLASYQCLRSGCMA